MAIFPCFYSSNYSDFCDLTMTVTMDRLSVRLTISKAESKFGYCFLIAG